MGEENEIEKMFGALRDKEGVLQAANLTNSEIDKMTFEEYFAHISFFPDALGKEKIGKEAYEFMHKGVEEEIKTMYQIGDLLGVKTIDELKKAILNKRLDVGTLNDIIKRGSLNNSFLNYIEKGYGKEYSNRFKKVKDMQREYFVSIFKQ